MRFRYLQKRGNSVRAVWRDLLRYLYSKAPKILLWLKLHYFYWPVSDFYGVYQHDLGHALMGVKSGIPFSIDLEDDYDDYG